MAEASEKKVTIADRVKVTFENVPLHNVVDVKVELLCTYKSSAAVAYPGGFFYYGPGEVTLSFRLGSSFELREAVKTAELMQKDRSMTIQWFGGGKTPITTTALSQVRFTKYRQIRSSETGEPLEELELRAESISFSESKTGK